MEVFFILKNYVREKSPAYECHKEKSVKVKSFRIKTGKWALKKKKNGKQNNQKFLKVLQIRRQGKNFTAYAT